MVKNPFSGLLADLNSIYSGQAPLLSNVSEKADFGFDEHGQGIPYMIKRGKLAADKDKWLLFSNYLI